MQHVVGIALRVHDRFPLLIYSVYTGYIIKLYYEHTDLAQVYYLNKFCLFLFTFWLLENAKLPFNSVSLGTVSLGTGAFKTHWPAMTGTP